MGRVLPRDEYIKSLAKRPMGVSAFFFNEAGEVLIVNPTYRDGWGLPGGALEENESPRQACMREVKEELGLEISPGRMFCVDYVSMEPSGDALIFSFEGGVLTPDQIRNIKLPADELSEYRFVSTDEAIELLWEKVSHRLPQCLEALKNGTTAYLEQGEYVT